MNLTKKITLVLATAAATCILHADEPATTDSPVGTLGQRYGELSVSTQDVSKISNNAYSAEVGANLPVTKFLDVGASYEYNLFKFNGQILHSNILEANATVYSSYDGVKPFLSAELGYERDRTTGPNFLTHANYDLWGLAVGVEIPVKMVSITPFISYNDDFRPSTQSSQAYNFGAEVNYWLNAKWAVFADASYQDILHSSLNSWTWTVGVRRRF